MLILPCLPFADAVPEWFAGLRKFAGWSNLNSPLRGIMSWAGVPQDWAKAITLALLGATALSATLAHRRGQSLRHACLPIMGAVVLCAPFTHFWYLAWALPLVALRPSLGWVVASIMQAGYFIAWWALETRGVWEFSREYPLFVWLPALVAFFLQQRGLPEPMQRVFGKRELLEGFGPGSGDRAS